MASLADKAALDAGLAAARGSLAQLEEVIREVARDGDDYRDKFVALFTASAGARAMGLTAALFRETALDNSHAVYVLMRALIDLVLVTMEVRRNPPYAAVLPYDPATSTHGRRRKSPQALIHAAVREVPDMKDAWNLLSEMGGHFGWAAFQTPISVENLPDARRVTVRTGPGWQDPQMKLSSLKHLSDLTSSMAGMLLEIATTNRPPR